MFGTKTDKIKKLSQKRGEKIANKLVAFTHDKDPEVALAAIEALGVVGGEPAANELIQLLQHSDADIRIAAANAIGAMGNPRTKVHLQYRVQKEEDPKVQEAVRHALANLARTG